MLKKKKRRLKDAWMQTRKSIRVPQGIPFLCSPSCVLPPPADTASASAAREALQAPETLGGGGGCRPEEALHWSARLAGEMALTVLSRPLGFWCRGP